MIADECEVAKGFPKSEFFEDWVVLAALY